MKHLLLGEKPDLETSAYRLILAEKNLKQSRADVYQFWAIVKTHALRELAYYV